jgi:hypothetical protein
MQHPTALTWNQMQGQFSYFVVASPNGSGTSGTVVSGGHVIDNLYTFVESSKSPLASSADDDRLVQENDSIEVAQTGDCEFEYDPIEAIAAELYASTQDQPADAFEAQAQEIADMLAELSLLALEA